MKALLLLPMIVGGFSSVNISPVYFFSPYKAILIQPTIKHQPLVWVNMVEGVKKFEGYYSTPYLCSAGVKTIGYGHTGKYTKRGFLLKKEAHDILLKDLKEAENHVRKNVKVPLNDGQLACLTSFTFNCGPENLKQLVNGKDRLNSGNYKSVKKLLPMYKKADGKTLEGLKLRRNWELKLWNDESNLYMVKN